MDAAEFWTWFKANQTLGLPGDGIAHFLLSLMIFRLCILIRLRTAAALLVVLAIAIFKEAWIDLSAIQNSGLYFEPVKDITASMLGAGTGAILLHIFGRDSGVGAESLPSTRQSVAQGE